MLLTKLREEVLEANLDLLRKGLVISTFGNVSGIAREEKRIVIKPSGLPYKRMKPADLVVTDLDGKVIEGKLRPSSDLATHVALYREFPSIGGVAHTHSEYATAWAQARKPIPCFGTTHADHFYGPVPVTEVMTENEVNGEYEANTGTVIIRAFDGLDPATMPAVLVANHGPFAWGSSPSKAAETAWILEVVARMAYFTLVINADTSSIGPVLRDRHFLRKHGKDAYYGQPGKKKK